MVVAVAKKRGRNCAEVKDDVYLEDQRSCDAHCVKEEEHKVFLPRTGESQICSTNEVRQT